MKSKKSNIHTDKSFWWGSIQCARTLPYILFITN